MASPSSSASMSPSASASASPSASASASPSQAVGSEQCLYIAEAKLHLRITASDDDTLLESYIDAATAWAQEYNGHKFLNTTCIDYLDTWPAVIRPQWAPLVSVTSIQYIDSGGTTQTWSNTEYDVDTDTEPGRIQPAYGYTYPTLRGDPNGIIVTYVAGYGASHDDVPTYVRHGILMLVGHWYRQREAVSELNLQQVPLGVRDLLGIGRLIHV